MNLEAGAPKLTKLLPLLGTNHDGEAQEAWLRSIYVRFQREGTH